MTQAAEIQEKAPKPQGLLPKNVQSWLLVGLAFLMVAIMWLTGRQETAYATEDGLGCTGRATAARSQRNKDQ